MTIILYWDSLDFINHYFVLTVANKLTRSLPFLQHAVLLRQHLGLLMTFYTCYNFDYVTFISQLSKLPWHGRMVKPWPMTSPSPCSSSGSLMLIKPSITQLSGHAVNNAAAPLPPPVSALQVSEGKVRGGLRPTPASRGQRIKVLELRGLCVCVLCQK